MKTLVHTGAVLVVIAAYAALLGWLKTLYFLKPFGLSPGVVSAGFPDALFESWYVGQNVLYFGFIVWLVVQTRRLSLALLATVYASIPLATHYAFLAYPNRIVRGWIDHQHTWLKLIPFVLIAGLAVAALRGRPLRSGWRYGATGWLVLALVVGSWGLSAAKHFGSYDAERILHRPRALLPRVELSWNSPSPAVERGLLLFADSRTVVVAVFPDVPAWTRARPVVHTIPRRSLSLISVSPGTEVQPGGQYF